MSLNGFTSNCSTQSFLSSCDDSLYNSADDGLSESNSFISASSETVDSSFDSDSYFDNIQSQLSEKNECTIIDFSSDILSDDNCVLSINKEIPEIIREEIEGEETDEEEEEEEIEESDFFFSRESSFFSLTSSSVR